MKSFKDPPDHPIVSIVVENTVARARDVREIPPIYEVPCRAFDFAECFFDAFFFRAAFVAVIPFDRFGEKKLW